MNWSQKKLLTKLVLIPSFVLISMKLTAPKAITEDIVENAPRFYVLGVEGTEFKKLTLKQAIESKEKYVYRLNQDSIDLDIGNSHRIEVVESTNDAQVIQFNYQNTYNSTSTYRVSNNTITPLKYKVNHHFGQVPIFVVSIILGALCSSLIVRFFSRRAESTTA